MIAPKAFCCLNLALFLIPSASAFRSQEGTVFLWSQSKLNTSSLSGSAWQSYECYKCFTSQATSFCPGSKQSWLNIHGTMAAWSHFLLGNKAPVYTALFWASQAAVTTAFLLPVRLCIIPTDSTLVKWYAAGYAAGNVSKKELHGGFINYDKWMVTCYVARALVSGSEGVQVEKIYSWRDGVSVIDGKYTGMRVVAQST